MPSHSTTFHSFQHSKAAHRSFESLRLRSRLPKGAIPILSPRLRAHSSVSGSLRCASGELSGSRILSYRGINTLASGDLGFFGVRTASAGLSLAAALGKAPALRLSASRLVCRRRTAVWTARAPRRKCHHTRTATLFRQTRNSTSPATAGFKRHEGDQAGHVLALFDSKMCTVPYCAGNRIWSDATRSRRKAAALCNDRPLSGLQIC